MGAKAHSLEDLYVHALKELRSALVAEMRALPKMARTAASPRLKAALEDRLAQGDQQVAKLTRILKELGRTTRPSYTHGVIDYIVEDMAGLTGAIHDDALRDAAVALAAVQMDRQQIAEFDLCKGMADVLGHNHQADELQDMREDDSQAERRISELSGAELMVRAKRNKETNDNH